jgi:hypothetical protein
MILWYLPVQGLLSLYFMGILNDPTAGSWVMIKIREGPIWPIMQVIIVPLDLFFLASSSIIFLFYPFENTFLNLLYYLVCTISFITVNVQPDLGYVGAIPILILATLVLIRYVGKQLGHQKHTNKIEYIIAFLALCYFANVMYISNEPISDFVLTEHFPPKLCVSPPSIPFAQQFENYKKMHKESLLLSSDKQKILLFYSTGDLGLGNRMLGLVSSFALSMITNRTFVVYWDSNSYTPAGLNDLFTAPFEWDAKSEKLKNIIWLNNRSMEDDPMFSYHYCRNCPIRRRFPEWDDLLCNEDFGISDKHRVVRVSSTSWFAPVMAHNLFHKKRICEQFGPDFFGTIFRALMKPSPEIEEIIAKVKENFAGASKVISLHLRRKEATPIRASHIQLFGKCASTLSDGNNTIWFLATDSQEVKDQYKQELGDKVITMDSVPTRLSRNGILNALAEMWLLGEANEIIISRYSTYSFVAHARTSLVPHIITESSLCVKLLSSQPCFQYWFGMFSSRCWTDEHMDADIINMETCWF